MASNEPTDPRRRPVRPVPDPERDPDHVDEGTGKQFARGVGDEPVPDPADPRHAETQAAGTGKQFGRGIGEPADEVTGPTGERPATDPREPDHVDKGTGKQFAQGVDEDPDAEPPVERPRREGTGKQYERGVGDDEPPAG